MSDKNNNLFNVTIFVNDELITATNNELVDMLARYLKDNFETIESKLDQFFEVGIDQRPDDSICTLVHYTSYCKRILKKLNVEVIKLVHISVDLQHSLNLNLSQLLQSREVPYREAVGSLLYLSQITDQI